MDVPPDLSVCVWVAGWVIATHPEPLRGGRPHSALRPPRRFLAKVFMHSGAILGLHHSRRQLMRTWEVIRDVTGHESYKREYRLLRHVRGAVARTWRVGWWTHGACGVAGVGLGA